MYSKFIVLVCGHAYTNNLLEMAALHYTTAHSEKEVGRLPLTGTAKSVGRVLVSVCWKETNARKVTCSLCSPTSKQELPLSTKRNLFRFTASSFHLPRYTEPFRTTQCR